MSVASCASSAWSLMSVIGTFGRVILGFGLARITTYLELRQKATGYFSGIESEINYAAKHARDYREPWKGKLIATDDFLSRSTAVKRATLKSENLCDGDPAAGTAITAQAVIRAAAKQARLKLAD